MSGFKAATAIKCVLLSVVLFPGLKNRVTVRNLIFVSMSLPAFLSGKRVFLSVPILHRPWDDFENTAMCRYVAPTANRTRSFFFSDCLFSSLILSPDSSARGGLLGWKDGGGGGTNTHDLRAEDQEQCLASHPHAARVLADA